MEGNSIDSKYGLCHFGLSTNKRKSVIVEFDVL